MDILKLTILVFSLFLSVKAQVTSNQHDANSLHPSMAVVLTVLTIMFFLSFLTLAYAKFCNHNNNRPNEAQDPNGNGIVISSRFSGIDKTIIESLPFFQFSSLKGTKEGLECAVCLSKFEDAEILRLLPKCRHAFHMNCIDAWLENHSSCPICRNKFDVGDLKSLTCTNSFRRSTSGDAPNLEFFIDREKNLERSARFSVSSAIQKLARVKREEPLIQDRRMLHNVKHRIIASDVICKSRWSDVNSSDMLSLNSEMLNFTSSNRFSSAEFNSKRFSEESSAKREILNINADSEKVKVSGEASNWAGSSNVGLHETAVSKLLDASQQRSMSEINNVSRFNQFSALRRVNMEKDEKVRRLWLPIAKRTIQRFAGRETSSDATKHVLEIRHQEDDRV